MELEFSNLNPYANIEFLEDDSADGLLKQIKGIRKQIKILALYAQGSKHYAWIQGDIKKTKKGN